MNRPKLLDLFCCAGGAAMGYHRAGFEVVGVDIDPQPHYPFEFHQADAIEYLLEHGDEFDGIHASPPCQLYSMASQEQRAQGVEYPDLLPPTRVALLAQSRPWIIENVPGAPMRADYKLCGCQFGLGVDHDGRWLGLRRERWFETSWHAFEMMPTHDHSTDYITVVGHGTPSWSREKLGFNPTMREKREAMGITWTDRGELSEAIPPAYTEFLGVRLMQQLLGAVKETTR
jgi:DNA (cytosine-5)-methyltransferase 1